MSLLHYSLPSGSFELCGVASPAEGASCANVDLTISINS